MQVGTKLTPEALATIAQRMREREAREYASENLASLRQAQIRAGIERP